MRSQEIGGQFGVAIGFEVPNDNLKFPGPDDVCPI